MQTNELFIAAVAHLLGFVVAATVIHGLGVGDPGLAFVVAACTGSAAAAISYHRRVVERAPFAVKAAAGGAFSGMVILTGILSQTVLGWMRYPEVVIPISAIGSFFFPWAIFGSMRNVYRQKELHAKDGSSSGESCAAD